MAKLILQSVLKPTVEVQVKGNPELHLAEWVEARHGRACVGSW